MEDLGKADGESSGQATIIQYEVASPRAQLGLFACAKFQLVSLGTKCHARVANYVSPIMRNRSFKLSAQDGQPV